MAYNLILAEKVRNTLALVTFEEKKAFGGLAFMVNGKMCISVNNRPDHSMMVRIDPDNKEALKKTGAKIALMQGREMPGWIFLTEEAIRSPGDLSYWIQLALDFNKKSAVSS